MKILIDKNIPYASELFSKTGKVMSVPGRHLPQKELNDADSLMVRSVTQVNESLLTKTPVKFVGTATAGTDHIDEAWLQQAGIAFSAAPGCNSIAVVEYVFSALLFLAERDGFELRERTVGIVGVGNVGRLLHTRLDAWGLKTLLCDPPRVVLGEKGDFRSLADLVAEADILTFHTPLFKEGPYKSWHLANAGLLNTLKPNTILINTCRGPVVDNIALLEVLKMRTDLSVVLDVWELEPELSLELLNNVDLATAHIAGYTLEGKARGTTQIFEAWCDFLGQPQSVQLSELLPTPTFSKVILNGTLDQEILKRLTHLVYDVRRDDASLRRVAAIPGEFDRLRQEYPERREWSSLEVICNNIETASMLDALGFRICLNNT
ncbi:4-phosphoerythronate dehydrogenase PdxB [Pantoea sp. Nvir]|uniref:4-phosphoerythronate dehydrogenase PdxB n=1 Tax=Pantoea sp. Nvir TaxID=2576760 RepID=UPI001359167F|nr:4-phosphoerythronate dehydrogenase PdxB [Pantoea sp. Nvir]MXP66596.1 4-phosphoerythronate dehydrogenase PdxB [Pantoea sp. Nvir]CAJ0992108.1 Erythronate-4-phosphate dehydrogenase [Pantoea sp. Nvir]